MTIIPTTAVWTPSTPAVGDPTASATTAVEARTAMRTSALEPNPRIEFDPKLRIAVLEFHDAGQNTVTRYPQRYQPLLSMGQGLIV